MSWRFKGLLLAAACLGATFLSPVLSYSCGRLAGGGVSCRVTRHALGVVPYSWTTIAAVVDSDSDFVPASRSGRSFKKRLIPNSPSLTINRIRARGRAAAWEWTTYSSIGADPGTIAIAIDELVAGVRERPLLAWQANAVAVFLVFVLGLPFAAAMLGRSYYERFLPRQHQPRPIARAYVVTLVVGVLLGFAIFWGSIPEPLAEALGLPAG